MSDNGFDGVMEQTGQQMTEAEIEQQIRAQIPRLRRYEVTREIFGDEGMRTEKLEILAHSMMPTEGGRVVFFELQYRPGTLSNQVVRVLSGVVDAADLGELPESRIIH